MKVIDKANSYSGLFDTNSSTNNFLIGSVFSPTSNPQKSVAGTIWDTSRYNWGIDTSDLNKSITSTTTTTANSTVSNTSGGFLPSLGSFVSNTLIPIATQVTPLLLKYKLTKYQLKKQAELARLQNSILNPPAPAIGATAPAGAGYQPQPQPQPQPVATSTYQLQPQPQPQPQPYPQPQIQPQSNSTMATPITYIQPQQNNMNKYLLYGGIGLGAILLISLLTRRD